MPQVPYQPFPSQAPENIPTPRIQIRTPEDAFGIGIAHAVSGLGKGEEEVGGELFQRAIALQQLQNQSDATIAKSNFITQAGLENEKFLATEGANASPAALEAHMKSLTDLRKQIRDSLPNRMAQQEYDAESTGFLARLSISSGGHAAQQMKAYHKLADQKGFAADLTDLDLNPNDPAAFEKARDGAVKYAKSRAAAEGLSPELEEELRKESLSKVFATQLTSRARSDPITTQKTIEDHKADLGDKYQPVKNTVESHFDTTMARNISNTVNSDLRVGKEDSGEPVESRIRRGMDVLDRKYGDYERLNDLKDLARNRIREDYSGYMRDRKDAVNHYWEDIRGAIQAGAKNVEDIQNNPQTRASYDALPHKDQMEVQHVIDRYRNKALAQTSMQTLERLNGMAIVNPEAFMNVDPTKEELSTPDVHKVWQRQAQMRKAAESFPQVNRAIAFLQRDGQLAKADLKPDKDDPRWQMFTGALQDAMTSLQEKNKRAPTPQEISDTGKQLLKGFVSGFWFGKPAWYEGQARDIPPKDLEDIKSKMMADSPGEVVSDEDVIREYAKQRFRQAVGMTSAKSKP